MSENSSTDRVPAQDIKFEIFGDESANDDVATFGVVIIPTAKVEAVKLAVRSVKADFGAETAKIHCKELFHDTPRQRSSWAHLSREDAFSLATKVSSAARSAGARTCVGVIDVRAAPQRMYFDGGGTIEEQEITDLHLVHMAYATAMGPVSDLIPLTQCRAWMDPNRSRLQWLGQNRQMRLSQGFFPFNHNNVRFEPAQIGEEKPMLLDLADIASHCAARALSRRRRDSHESVMHAIRPGLSEAQFGPTGGAVLAIRADTSAVEELRRDLLAMK